MKKYLLISLLASFICIACKEKEQPQKPAPSPTPPAPTPEQPVPQPEPKPKEEGKATIVLQEVYLYADSNNDKHISKGEKVRLNVALKNTGTATATNVKATFSTNSAYVIDFHPTTPVLYGTMPIGMTAYKGQGEKDSDYAVGFTVSNTTPAGTLIPINVLMTNGNDSWQATFTVTVEALDATIGFHEYYIKEDDNNDKEVNKGERIKLNVALKNSGSSTAQDVKATFTINSAYVTNVNAPEASYRNIAGNSSAYKYKLSKESDYVLSFEVKRDTPNNTVIPIQIAITDAFNNQWQSSFQVVVKATAAHIAFAEYYVIKDIETPDGKVLRGKKAKVNVALKNTGSSEARKVKATFTTNSPYVIDYNSTPAISYDIIRAHTTAWQEGLPKTYRAVLNFTVDANAPAGATIPINIVIVDDYGNSWNDSFNIRIEDHEDD